MRNSAEMLMEMYKAMRDRFGHQGWWPGDGPLETCIGAILTQNTNWRNVEKAIANLRQAGLMNVSALHATEREEIATLIRPAGYFNVKAKRLGNFIQAVNKDFADDIEAFLDRPVHTLREELLAINGIGQETADSIILYAAEKPSFVVDTYTCRIMLRHELIWMDDDYASVKDFLEGALPTDVALWNDYHAQLVAVGKQYCRPRARCDGCPLAQFPHDPRAGVDDYD